MATPCSRRRGSGPSPAPSPDRRDASRSSGVGIAEGWRGTIVHRIETAGYGRLSRVKGGRSQLLQLAGATPGPRRHDRARLPVDQQELQPLLRRQRPLIPSAPPRGLGHGGSTRPPSSVRPGTPGQQAEPADDATTDATFGLSWLRSPVKGPAGPCAGASVLGVSTRGVSTRQLSRCRPAGPQRTRDAPPLVRSAAARAGWVVPAAPSPARSRGDVRG